MPPETLPELIHRLVADPARGRDWVERELGYAPGVIDEYLAAYAEDLARRHPLTGPPTAPGLLTSRGPMTRAELARHLRTRHDTLTRALSNDPKAPQPVPGRKPPVWPYAEVYAWWPNRRRRGQRGPARRTALAAAPATPEEGSAP
ncbi:hypothetical protein SMD44_p10166 (plasmid) [Streptomyces alboflavus]|uniref:Uncharacterized protein n=1 Tax=Streptomyces alboflavus TaxID=67267 RepID=A0A291W3G1_9ACTN|nr:hypothetical protein [Streptomyces alboflavus]ATM24665.1 hypothetical protein SMD44_p10166 [Streptomyces alboflavus]